VTLLPSGTAFAVPEAHVEPTSFFAPFVGTFSPTGSMRRLSLVTVGDGTLNFTVDTLDIAVVPEPAVFGLVACGAAGLMIGLARRRRDAA